MENKIVLDVDGNVIRTQPENFLVIYAKSNKQIFCKNMEASSFGEAEMKAKTAFLKENIAKNEKIRILQITVYN